MKEILDQFLSELSGASPATINPRRFYAGKFLQFAGDRPFQEWDKTMVTAFISQLEKEGYAPSTIRNAYGIVKRVFDAAKTVHERQRTKLISEVNPEDPSAVAVILQAMALPGPTWDIPKRGIVPRVDMMNRPASTRDEIKKIVATAKNGGLEPPEICYLALSSIYALRRGELCAVRKEHFDFNDNTLFVMTEKGGERRKQLLCDEILPFLKEYDFGVEYSPYMMSRMWKVIRCKCGFSNSDGEGWHSNRRYLDTELRDSLASDPNLNRDAQLITKIFFRWRLSSSSEMTDRYYTADPLIADKIALAHHPVVPLWA